MSKSSLSEQEMELVNILKTKTITQEDKDISVIVTFAIHQALQYDDKIVSKALEIAEKDGSTMQQIVSEICLLLPDEINDYEEDK